MFVAANIVQSKASNGALDREAFLVVIVHTSAGEISMFMPPGRAVKLNNSAQENKV
jgi:hypothetical protein